MSSLAGVHSVAYVTVPDDAVAKRLARGLVENKLAACVNIIPRLTSIYEWEGKIQEESELLLRKSSIYNLRNNLFAHTKWKQRLSEVDQRSDILYPSGYNIFRPRNSILFFPSLVHGAGVGSSLLNTYFHIRKPLLVSG
ncbi:Protein CutA like protein [Atta colombica]|uniref:Protein CutA like protein n=1 Tax=Atta colombica TaxID=520822 RepID=A0A151I504_9HYME|nr:Protein CutA like protein [Atta colombica]